MTPILLVVVVIGAALTAGGLVAVHVALVPTMLRLPDTDAVRLHQIFDPLIHRYMPAATVATVLAAAVLLVTAEIPMGPRTLMLVGVANTIVTIIVSQFLNVPINRTIRKWGGNQVPDEYRTLRRTWMHYNLVRTITAVAALVGYTIAAVSG